MELSAWLSTQHSHSCTQKQQQKVCILDQSGYMLSLFVSNYIP